MTGICVLPALLSICLTAIAYIIFHEPVPPLDDVDPADVDDDLAKVDLDPGELKVRVGPIGDGGVVKDVGFRVPGGKGPGTVRRPRGPGRMS